MDLPPHLKALADDFDSKADHLLRELSNISSACSNHSPTSKTSSIATLKTSDILIARNYTKSQRVNAAEFTFNAYDKSFARGQRVISTDGTFNPNDKMYAKGMKTSPMDFTFNNMHKSNTKSEQFGRMDFTQNPKGMKARPTYMMPNNMNNIHTKSQPIVPMPTDITVNPTHSMVTRSQKVSPMNFAVSAIARARTPIRQVSPTDLTVTAMECQPFRVDKLDVLTTDRLHVHMPVVKLDALTADRIHTPTPVMGLGKLTADQVHLDTPVVKRTRQVNIEDKGIGKLDLGDVLCEDSANKIVHAVSTAATKGITSLSPASKSGLKSPNSNESWAPESLLKSPSSDKSSTPESLLKSPSSATSSAPENVLKSPSSDASSAPENVLKSPSSDASSIPENVLKSPSIDKSPTPESVLKSPNSNNSPLSNTVGSGGVSTPISSGLDSLKLECLQVLDTAFAATEKLPITPTLTPELTHNTAHMDRLALSGKTIEETGQPLLIGTPRPVGDREGGPLKFDVSREGFSLGHLTQSGLFDTNMDVSTPPAVRFGNMRPTCDHVGTPRLLNNYKSRTPRMRPQISANKTPLLNVFTVNITDSPKFTAIDIKPAEKPSQLTLGDSNTPKLGMAKLVPFFGDNAEGEQINVDKGTDDNIPTLALPAVNRAISEGRGKTWTRRLSIRRKGDTPKLHQTLKPASEKKTWSRRLSLRLMDSQKQNLLAAAKKASDKPWTRRLSLSSENTGPMVVKHVYDDNNTDGHNLNQKVGPDNKENATQAKKMIRSISTPHMNSVSTFLHWWCCCVNIFFKPDAFSF